MKYDFTTILERKGHDALAVDALGEPGFPGLPEEGWSVIPMWVADMNFPVPPVIQEHLNRRISHPAFGYFEPSEEYYSAIVNWQEKRNRVSGLTKDQIGYENGVLGGLMSALTVICVPGDRILVHEPTYIGFRHSLSNAGYRLVPSPLVRDGDGVWRMDFEDMERKFREKNIHAMIFCSPQNPSGRVWTAEEMERMMDLCRRYDVYVISDEIWSDLILTHSPVSHTPLQNLSEEARQRTIALYAPSKTFNLAGLVGSYHIIRNPRRLLGGRTGMAGGAPAGPEPQCSVRSGSVPLRVGRRQPVLSGGDLHAVSGLRRMVQEEGDHHGGTAESRMG